MRLTRRTFIFTLLASVPSISLAGPFSNVGKKGGDSGGGNSSSSSEKSDGEMTPKEKCAKYGHDWPEWPDWSTIPDQIVEIVPGVECIAFKQRWRTCKRCNTTGHQNSPERDVPCPKHNSPSCK